MVFVCLLNIIKINKINIFKVENISSKYNLHLNQIFFIHENFCRVLFKVF
jgi:hypothetical protein